MTSQMQKWTHCAAFLLVCSLFPGIRGELKPDQINETLSWTPSDDIKGNYSYFLSGYDDFGSPVYIVELGNWSLVDAVAQGTGQQDVVAKIWLQAFLRASKAGKEPTSNWSIVIINMDGYEAQGGDFGVQKLSDRLFKTWVDIPNDGGIKKQYIVNGGKYFQKMYDILKGSLGDLTTVTMVYGEDAKEWQHILLGVIEPEQLPFKYGGIRYFHPVEVYP